MEKRPIINAYESKFYIAAVITSIVLVTMWFTSNY